MSGDEEGGHRPAPAVASRWRPPVAVDDPRHPTASPAVALVWDGVVWSRLGDGDRAFRCWDEVDDDALAAWVEAERGRVLRELGLHAAARRHDLAGLAVARDATDMVMLRLSHAADVLGDAVAGTGGDVGAAARVLGTATALLDELPDGPRVARQRLRATWIATELALARGERPDGAGLPRRDGDEVVQPPDAAHGTDFHRAKGLLFAGVVHHDRWLLDRAAELAPPALLWAVELARADAGDDTAAARAATAWRVLRPPAAHAAAVAETVVGRRLGGAP